MKVLVSACLLGRNCKYNGGNNYTARVEEFLADKEIIPVCPEELAGLGTPRIPMEIVKGRLTDRDGRDLDEILRRTVAEVVESLKKEKIDLAILKARSPTCGAREIYDGTFSGTRIPGMGIFAQALKDAGIPVVDEEEEDYAVSG